MDTRSTELGSTFDQHNSMAQAHEIIDIPSSPKCAQQPDPQPPSPNRPCGNLLGSREDVLSFCAPLYDASITADWKKAKDILNKMPKLVRYAINESYETPLHVAVSLKGSYQRTTFVEKLLQMMESKDLELLDRNDNTALCSAAIAGNVEAARLILLKKKAIPDGRWLHLYHAAVHGKHDMVRFLYDMSWRRTDLDRMPQVWAGILVECIKYDMFDVALKIVRDIKELDVIFQEDIPSNKVLRKYLLYALAPKTEAFTKRKETLVSKIVNPIFSHKNLIGRPVETHSDAMKILKRIWENILRMEKTDIEMILRYPHGSLDDTLFVAAESGNTAFVVELFRGHRDLILKTNNVNRTIIHIAVLKGHEGIYNLIHEIGSSMKKVILSLEDDSGNNMLHLFGLRSRDQMTRRPMHIVQEYRWYKEVEMMLTPEDREKKNKSDNKTPYELFSKNSQEAFSESLVWADYGLVVATLVLGSSFAATCSVPGGFDQNKGYPVLTNEPSFLVFAVADTIAFLASVVSVLSFLSIVIFGRRHKEQMFASLVTSMLLGITALLLSIMAMMVALSASLIIVYHNSLRWMIAPMFALFFITIISFLVDQFPLFKDMFLSMYHRRHPFNPM